MIVKVYSFLRKILAVQALYSARHGIYPFVLLGMIVLLILKFCLFARFARQKFDSNLVTWAEI